ncbi:MAG: hypothetical protein IKZ84_13765 [Victivallales bacterium]|nr:hypothetical protein [Victivallales bacterium]
MKDQKRRKTMSSEDNTQTEETNNQANTETSENTENTTPHEVAIQPVDKDDTANEIILWGAGRAAAIALAPIPLADVGPLMANEAYMIYRLANNYDCKIDESVVAMLLGVSGGSIVGKIAASFLPFLKVPIAAGITYAIGKTAKAYFNSGMTLSPEDMKDLFENSRTEAEGIDWTKKKVAGDQL